MPTYFGLKALSHVLAALEENHARSNPVCFGFHSGRLQVPWRRAGATQGTIQGSDTTKQVRATETLNTEHLAAEDEAAAHEVLTVAVGDTFATPLSEVLAQQHLQKRDIPRLAQDKRFVGALDNACNRTCAGSFWLVFYLQALQAAPKPIQDLVTTIEEDELFRFGNGGAQKSNVRYRLPMALGSTLVLVWVSIVPVPSLGLLLGRDFLSGIGAVLSFSRKKLRADLVNGEMLDLGQLAAGHFSLPLQPSMWPRPGSQRWRRLGRWHC